VRVEEVGHEQLILRRDVRVLHLAPGLTHANVVFVFKSPAHIERFTYGAECAGDGAYRPAPTAIPWAESSSGPEWSAVVDSLRHRLRRAGA